MISRILSSKGWPATRVCAVVLLVAALSAAVVHGQEPPNERPVITIGVVYDGPPSGQEAGVPERLEDLPAMIHQETATLTARDFTVRCPVDKHLSGNWTMDGIRSALDRHFADPEVDIVVTLGIFSTNEVARRQVLPKPVVAPFAIDIEAQDLPFESNDDGRLVSGVKNLNYITTPGSILRDIRKFREIAEFSEVYVLADALVGQAIPEIPETVIAGGRELGIDLPLVSVIDSAADALAQIGPEAEAVYVTPLHRMPPDEFDLLIAGLIDRRLPSFSMLGRPEVERGIMAGVRPETDFPRLSRRIAINIQRILMGEDAGDLPVILDLQEKLVINMATATAIQVFPRLRVAMTAELIQLEAEEIKETLTLSQAVETSVRTNLVLMAADRGVAAGAENVRRARSFLKPQLDFSAAGIRIDSDRAAASFGAQAEKTLVGGVSLSQTVFSEDARAGLQISKDLQRSLEEEWETVRLDIALRAAREFLNLLRAETLERVTRENLRLTETNLSLARRREQVGFSGPADVYRWESRLATDRSTLIGANAQVNNEFIALNRTMNRPLEDLYKAVPPTLGEPDMVTGVGRLNPYVDSLAGFTLFKEFMVHEGLNNSVELEAIDAAIAAEERESLAARRSFWLPEVDFVGDYARQFSKRGEGSEGGPFTPDRNLWSVSLRAGFPLYVGGFRRARFLQSTEELSQLRFERTALVQSIDLRIREALYNISSTFPSIELAQEAAAAARKNLDLVTDSYSRGAMSVIDLLDAQNAALIAEEFAANAVFDFLLDLMDLQRASNSFDFFRSDQERDAWFDRLEAYFDQARGMLRWPKR